MRAKFEIIIWPLWFYQISSENMALFQIFWKVLETLEFVLEALEFFLGKIPDIFDKLGKTKTNLMSMMNIVTALGAEDNRILPSENS